MPVTNLGSVKRGSSLRRRPRHLSRLGLLLIGVGLVAAAVTYSALPPNIYRFWPLILVAIGAAGLLRRPGWAQDLEVALPGTSELALWPRRAISWFAVVLGLVLLPFTLHLVDERVVGPLLLILLGVYFLWRRAR